MNNSMLLPRAVEIAGVVTRSRHKIILLDFVMKTKNNAIYEFECIESDVDRFVQQMRVELSRFRADLKARRIPINKFKIMNVGTEPVPDKPGVCCVKLLRKVTHATELDQATLALFKNYINGKG